MTFRVQQQIRQNASDIRTYLDDLFVWEEKVNTSQPDKNPTKPASQAKQKSKENYPIRGQPHPDELREEENRRLAESNPADQGAPASSSATMDLIRDKSSIPAYYDAWDKYANNLPEEVEPVVQTKPQEPVNPMQKTSGAEKNTKIVIKGGRSSYNEVESMKEKGNLFFKNQEIDKAVEMYTESLKRGVLQKVNNELMVVLYSNRAMAYLKLREYIKAEDDCNNALKLNEKHVKSLVRRGQAKRRLEKFKEALRDYKNALEVEPNNKEIQEEIRVITKKIANTKDERKKNLVLPVSVTEKQRTTVRVEDYDPEKPTEEKLDTVKPSVAETKDSGSAQPINGKPPVNAGEATSEFLTLKDVEGKMVKHEDVPEEEAPKQQVHFRVDLNTEDSGVKLHYQPVLLDKKPKKSSLKRKRQFGGDPIVEPKAKKEANIIELKTAKAVLQGKEMWQKQVIEGYERTVAAKEGEKPKEEVKKVQLLANSSEFLNFWKHIKDNQEACEKLLMGQAKPERFAEIFGGGLEFDLFMELLKFGNGIAEKNKKLAADMLQGIAKIKRFDINVKSMLSSEKKVIREIVDKVLGNDGVEQSVVDEIKLRYKI